MASHDLTKNYSLTEEEMYDYYLSKKNTGQNHAEIIIGMLASQFDLNVSVGDKETDYEITQIKSKLQYLIKREATAKRTDIFRERIFLDLKQYPKLWQGLKIMNETLAWNMPLSQDDEYSVLFDDETQTSPVEDTTMSNRKSFLDLKSRSQRKIRSSNILTQLEECAKQEKLPLDQYIGFLGYNHCRYVGKYKKAAIFQKIWKNDEVEETNEVPLETALYLKEKSLMGKRNYMELRTILKPHVVFPPYYKLTSYIHDTMPNLIYFNGGVRSDAVDVAIRTLDRLPDFVVDILDSKVSENAEISFIANFSAGLDASGGHKVYNSSSYLNATKDSSHYVVAGMALTSISVNNLRQTNLFTVEKTCSYNNQRPIAIFPGKETRANIAELAQLLNASIAKGKEDTHIIDFGGFQANFKINIVLNQVDTKMIKMLSGLTGAYCTFCNISEKGAHNVNSIVMGFPNTRDINGLNNLFDELCVLDENGKEFIPRRKDDYLRRRGLCQRPLTKADVCTNITILHSYLNSLTFFERIIYCLNAKVYKMSGTFEKLRFSSTEKRKLSQAKGSVQEKAKKNKLFMKLDMPDSTGHGGSSDTGNVAKRFFSDERRNAVLELIDITCHEDDMNKKKIADMLQRFSVILRIISSKDHLINYIAFQNYCRDTYMIILEYFHWIRIPGTIHRMLAHSAQRIHINSDYGLGTTSEEGLESVHKMVRRYRAQGSRKCGMRENLEDIWSHWWIASDPKIRFVGTTQQCKSCYETKNSKVSKLSEELANDGELKEHNDEEAIKKLLVH